jgi:hypothetical protein
VCHWLTWLHHQLAEGQPSALLLLLLRLATLAWLLLLRLLAVGLLLLLIQFPAGATADTVDKKGLG